MRSTTYPYKIVEGHKIMADVYRTPGTEARPAVIWIHSGGLIIGSRSDLCSYQLERYLGQGYIVVSIDYRLAPETKLPAIVDDLEDAYAWLRLKGPGLFNVDPNRIALVGHSGGGYLALVGGVRLRPPPRALVSFYGYGDITGSWIHDPSSSYTQSPMISRDQAMEFIGASVVSTTPPEPEWPSGRAAFYIYCRQQGVWQEEVSGHDPQREAAWFLEYEPLRNITAAYPPTFLLHGERDEDVPFQQSVLMARALKREGVEHEFIGNPDWLHMFDECMDDDPAAQEAFARVLSFLDTHFEYRKEEP